MNKPIPSNYAATLASAKSAIQAARTRAVLAVNGELIRLYWSLGKLILERQDAEGWGAHVIERLSNDLRSEFPGMTGLSVSNLKYMRVFAREWPEAPIGQQLVDQLPWGHNILLLTKLDDQELREWYARSAIESGWSRAVLTHQIMSQLHRRVGAAPSNFERLLPAGDSELMQQATKDPYALEFLTIAREAHERDVEQALIDHLDRFLRELGAGFAYMGRQWRLGVGGDEFFIDLLMFNTIANRYLVIELKHRKLTPGDIGQLNFYVTVVDDVLRQPHHAPTVGLLLCTDRDDTVVRYALSAVSSPMAVAGYTYKELPAIEQATLPDENDLREIVAQALEAAQADD
jgi:predicted nuclease of restriction endonuclease-like (RecB) superfamily